MTTRSELAVIRAQSLARVRAATGQAERFSLSCACARHDRTFTLSFARLPGSQQFRCEAIDKDQAAPGTLQRLAGLVRAPEPLRVATAEIDFAGLPCPWCDAGAKWTLCSRCKAMVCGAQTDTESFRCRASCGAAFRTAPLHQVDAARDTRGAASLAISYSIRPLLPGSHR